MPRATLQKAELPILLLERDAMLIEKADHFAEVVVKQMQANRRHRIRRAFQNRADQARLETREKAHGLNCSFAQKAQLRRL